MATRQLRVEIVGDPRHIMRTFDSIEKSTGRMARGFSRATTLVGAGLAAMAGGAVVGAIKSMVDEARQAEKVGRQTAAVIKATGGVAKVSAKDVDRLADALSNKVGVDDEIIAAGQNMLLTFKNVRNEAGRQNDIFNQTTRVALDMTAALNQGEVSQQGLEQTTMRLGKALNDPIKGISALTRVGVTFTDAQKEQIKTLVESGRTMDAQKLILKELASEFGGAAEAAADPWQRIGVAFDNIKEKIGTALLPALNNAATFITDKLIPAAEKWWRDHGPKVRDVFGDIATFIGDAWTVIRDKLLPVIKDMATQLVEKMLPGLEDTAAAWRDNSEAIEDLGKDFKDLKPLWDFLLFVIHKISTEEIPGFINQIGWIGRAWQAVRKPVLTAVQLMVREVLAGFGQILHGAAAAFGWVPGVGEKLKRARDAFDKFQQDVNEEFRQIITGKTVNLNVKGVFQPPSGMSMRSIVFKAAGGPVSGRGTSTSDSIPAMLSRGEHVLSAREVQGMGGHGAVEQMRQQARGFAQGGGIGIESDFPSARGMAGAGQGFVERLAALIARNVRATASIASAFPPHVPGGWQVALQFLRSLGIDYNVISTFRPGARTRASGSVSYHALNRAVDLTGNMMAVFNALSRTNPTELIYSHAPRYKSRSGWHDISRLDPITFMDHLSHVHAAYDRGGWLPPGMSLAINRTGRPERVLAPGEGGFVGALVGAIQSGKTILEDLSWFGMPSAFRSDAVRFGLLSRHPALRHHWTGTRWNQPGLLADLTGAGGTRRPSGSAAAPAPAARDGITVNFYGPVYGDRRALTEVVRQTWKEQLRREGKGALAAQL